MIKKCPICGKEFETEMVHKKFCDNKCKNINASRLYHERKKGVIAPAKPKVKKHKKPNQDLVDIARAAREAGMTYGQYIARTEGGMK